MMMMINYALSQSNCSRLRLSCLPNNRIWFRVGWNSANWSDDIYHDTLFIFYFFIVLSSSRPMFALMTVEFGVLSLHFTTVCFDESPQWVDPLTVKIPISCTAEREFERTPLMSPLMKSTTSSKYIYCLADNFASLPSNWTDFYILLCSPSAAHWISTADEKKKNIKLKTSRLVELPVSNAMHNYRNIWMGDLAFVFHE